MLNVIMFTITAHSNVSFEPIIFKGTIKGTIFYPLYQYSFDSFDAPVIIPNVIATQSLLMIKIYIKSLSKMMMESQY